MYSRTIYKVPVFKPEIKSHFVKNERSNNWLLLRLLFFQIKICATYILTIS